MNTQIIAMSVVELRSRVNAVVAARQAPVRARQSRIRNLDLPDSTAEAARLVKEAASSEHPEKLLERAAVLLQDDDKHALMRTLSETCAATLDSQLEEIARSGGSVSALDYQVGVLSEQGRKIRLAKVGGIGGATYTDASLSKHFAASGDLIRQTVAHIRDQMHDDSVTGACEQLLLDLAEYETAIDLTEAI